MAISFEDYGASYSGTDFNGFTAQGIFQLQRINLNEALRKYDFSSQRIDSLINEAVSYNTFRYMNMKYLAAAFYIMEGFSEVEIVDAEQALDAFDDYIKQFLNTESIFDRVYFKLVVESKQNTLKNYIPKMKRELLSYCYKIFIIRTFEKF
jgi:hypothetical protein